MRRNWASPPPSLQSFLTLLSSEAQESSWSFLLITVGVDCSANMATCCKLCMLAQADTRGFLTYWFGVPICGAGFSWWMVCNAQMSQDFWQLPGYAAAQNKWSRPGVSMLKILFLQENNYIVLTVWMWRMPDCSLLVDRVFCSICG